MTGAYSLTMGGAAASGSALGGPRGDGIRLARGAAADGLPLLALSWLPAVRRRAETLLTGPGAMHNRGDLAVGAGLAGDAVPRHQLAGLLRDYRLAAVDSAEYGL